MSETYQFREDDAELNAAIDEARRKLPILKKALDADARRIAPLIEGVLVKVRFESSSTHAVEHLWLEDAGFENERIVGTVCAEPNDLPEIRKGEWVSSPLESVTDWVYRQEGRTFGGFTVRVMQKRGLQP